MITAKNSNGKDSGYSNHLYSIAGTVCMFCMFQHEYELEARGRTAELVTLFLYSITVYKYLKSLEDSRTLLQRREYSTIFVTSLEHFQQ